LATVDVLTTAPAGTPSAQPSADTPLPGLIEEALQLPQGIPPPGEDVPSISELFGGSAEVLGEASRFGPLKIDIPFDVSVNSQNSLPVRHGKPVSPIAQDAGLATLPLLERRKLRYDSPLLDDYAVRVEKSMGLPSALLVSVKNYGERSNNDQVSSANARGVMQFIPSTAELFGLDDPTDPVAALEAGGEHLLDALKRYNGDVAAAIIDYNGGPKQVENYLTKKPLAKETKNYLARVLRGMKELTGRPTAVASEQ